MQAVQEFTDLNKQEIASNAIPRSKWEVLQPNAFFRNTFGDPGPLTSSTEPNLHRFDNRRPQTPQPQQRNRNPFVDTFPEMYQGNQGAFNPLLANAAPQFYQETPGNFNPFVSQQIPGNVNPFYGTEVANSPSLAPPSPRALQANNVYISINLQNITNTIGPEILQPKQEYSQPQRTQRGKSQPQKTKHRNPKPKPSAQSSSYKLSSNLIKLAPIKAFPSLSSKSRQSLSTWKPKTTTLLSTTNQNPSPPARKPSPPAPEPATYWQAQGDLLDATLPTPPRAESWWVRKCRPDCSLEPRQLLKPQTGPVCRRHSPLGLSSVSRVCLHWTILTRFTRKTSSETNSKSMNENSEIAGELYANTSTGHANPDLFKPQ